MAESFAVEAQNAVGGYDRGIFYRPVDDAYICPVCEAVLRSPVQTGCGNRVCQSCARFFDGSAFDHDIQVFKDRHCEQEIAVLWVDCRNNRHGCWWNGPLKSLEEHQMKCEYMIVMCPYRERGCRTVAPHREIRSHTSQDCLYCDKKCPHCAKTVPLVTLQLHIRDECAEVPQRCSASHGAVAGQSQVTSSSTEALLSTPNMVGRSGFCPSVSLSTLHRQTSTGKLGQFTDGYDNIAPIQRRHNDPSLAALSQENYMFYSSSQEDMTGGYDVDFVDPLENRDQCAVCQFALRDPVQTECGHRYCSSCFNGLKRSDRPRCLASDCEEALTAAFPDKGCKREILSLRVKCANHLSGCQWTGPLRDLKQHLEECGENMRQLHRNQKHTMERIDFAKGGTPMLHLPRSVHDMSTKVFDLGSKVVTKAKTLLTRHSSQGRFEKLSQTKPNEWHATEERHERLKMQVKEALSCATTADAKAMASSQSIEAVKSQIMNLEHQQAELMKRTSDIGTSLEELNIRLLNQETMSVNGVLVWKVTDYSIRFEEAYSGVRQSLYSPPFYTSRHGYKMCVRVYLNGDGSAKNSHMSIFFVVMRGEFDEILSWPFHQKVTLTLLDQSDAKKHISDTFKPDQKSSSFQRPKSEMNIASGCPQFVSLETLRVVPGYVKENRIIIRVTVDTDSLPNY